MVVLVLLPVAAMIGAATLLETVTPTGERTATDRMGTADLIVYPQGPASTTDTVRALLPADSQVEPFVNGEGYVVLPGQRASVTVWSLDLDGLAKGMLTFTAGRAPTRTGEVAISRSVADLANVGIGDHVSLQAPDPASGGPAAPPPVSGTAGGAPASPIVVGLIEDPFDIRGRIAVEDPSTAQAAAAVGQATYLVGLPPGSDPEAIGAELAGPSPDGHQSLSVTRRDQVAGSAGASSAGVIVFGSLALVETILVASAAFAVSVRRRQRELGLLAAAGAEPRHLAATVLAEGIVLGGIGVLLGAVVGFGGALAISPWLDQLTDRRNPPVLPDPVVIVTVMAIGLFATLLAAAVPAWSAGRLPVLAALSGRRPPRAPARRLLGLGLGLIGLGVAATMTGSLLRLNDVDGSSGTFSLLLLATGAIVGTLGFGACSPWLLERLEPLAGRLPLAGRIAVRDTARARSRTAPVVTAVLSTFAATVALSGYIAAIDANARAHWQPWLRSDQILIAGPGAVEVGQAVARELGGTASGLLLPAASSDGDAHRYLQVAAIDSSQGVQDDIAQGVTIADAELLRALGAEAAAADLQAGKVILLTTDSIAVTHVALQVTQTDGSVLTSLDVPARDVAVGLVMGDLPGAAVSADTAARLGIAPRAADADPVSDRFLVRLDHAITDDDQARAVALAAQEPDTSADIAIYHSPDQDFRVFLLVASLLFGLAVTGIAVALGETEARPDQRVLLALGADPPLRRRIAAARAGVVAILAGLLAVPAGLLPVWGLLASRGSPLVLPWPEVAAALVVLPLLAMAATFVLSRPIPPWSAFRDARS